MRYWLSTWALIGSVGTLIVISGCQKAQQTLDPQSTPATAQTTPIPEKPPLPRHQYDNLQLRLAAGGVDMSELRWALTDPDVTALTKTTHLLPAMAWHRSALYLIDDLWALKSEKYPELNWRLIAEPPVRIALASTLARLQKEDKKTEYIDYINRFRDDPDPFNQLQVIIAMGYMRDSGNTDYLASRLNSASPLIVKNAISALASLGEGPARNIVVELGKTHHDETMRLFINKVLAETQR